MIPLAAVPVSLVGTLAVMHLFGFSLNALSLFGLVLAIGIVVDDAIVVVENVERNIARGLAPIDAAQASDARGHEPDHRDRALVLIAVFVPTAFISGLARPVLRAVRVDHRDQHGDLGVQLADAVARARGVAAEAARRAAATACSAASTSRSAGCSRPFNRFFEWLSRALRRARGQVAAPLGRGARSSTSRSSVVDLARLHERARGLHPAAGQGVPRRVRAAARGRDARPHRRGDPPHDRHHAGGARRRARGRVPGPLDQRLREQRRTSGIAFAALRDFRGPQDCRRSPAAPRARSRRR